MGCLLSFSWLVGARVAIQPSCCAGRYSKHTSLVLVTHGLAARIFLMRWFHWTVEQFMEVYNPPNAEVRALAPATLHASQDMTCLPAFLSWGRKERLE